MNEGIQLIPYSLPQEKQIILHYANLPGDTITKEIIERDRLENNEEAEHLANFFWNMVESSNDEDGKSGKSTEYILEKIIITFMAYFRSSGYEEIWGKVSDSR